MKLIAKVKEKEIWFHEDSKPYNFQSPFVDEQYVCVIFNNDKNISVKDQYEISKKIVRSGCRFAVCAGHNCSTWDDSIDEEYLATDENFNPPDETFVMTTWHENDSVADIVLYMWHNTNFDDLVFNKYLIYSVGKQDFVRCKIIQEINVTTHTLKNDK